MKMQIESKPAPETRRSAARLTEAKLGNALLETHRKQSGSRLVVQSVSVDAFEHQARKLFSAGEASTDQRRCGHLTRPGVCSR